MRQRGCFDQHRAPVGPVTTVGFGRPSSALGEAPERLHGTWRAPGEADCEPVRPGHVIVGRLHLRALVAGVDAHGEQAPRAGHALELLLSHSCAFRSFIASQIHMAGPGATQKIPMRSGGQYVAMACPMIHPVGTGPQYLLSSDAPRLSPIMNQ
jgi:hypothetical protein